MSRLCECHEILISISYRPSSRPKWTPKGTKVRESLPRPLGQALQIPRPPYRCKIQPSRSSTIDDEQSQPTSYLPLQDRLDRV